MSDENEATVEQAEPEQAPSPEQVVTFTQAEVDKIVGDRLRREQAKYADYESLKAKSEQVRSTEERLTDLEDQLTRSKRELLRRRVQSAHGLSDADCDLFLTGDNEETLIAQAKRLLERDEDLRANRGNYVPGEGSNPKPGNTSELAFVRGLAGLT